MEQFRRLARWLALIVGAIVALAFGLFELGAHVHSLPVLAPFGSLLLNWFAPWFVVLPLVAAAMIWFAGPRNRRGLRKGLSLFAVAVAMVGGIALFRMAAAAQVHGVPVGLARSFATHAPLPSAPDHDIVYSSNGGKPLRLVIYSPNGGNQRGPAPVLLYVHGGGWVEGDRFAGGENMRWFAEEGWLAIAIDYPLSSRERHLWDSTTEQVGCAMAWAGANIERFGGDPKRISLLGDSAGGNLVLNAGYSANAGTLRSACGGSVPRVAAVSAIYPAVDLAEVYRGDFPQISDMARGYADAYVGGSPDRFPERYARINPSSYIHRQAPPTLLIVGENDHLLPPQLTYRFHDQAKRGGVKVELIRFPYGQHLFDQATNSLGNQLVLGASRKFFERHPR